MKTPLLLLLSSLCLVACGEKEHAPHPGQDDHDHSAEASLAFQIPEGDVFFKAPLAGAELKSPVSVSFGIEKVTVNPAGEIVHGTGHHHLLINQGPIAPGMIVPADENHIHFGKGQTETTVELKPGAYTLTMQLADGIHRSYGKALAASIQITVVE